MEIRRRPSPGEEEEEEEKNPRRRRHGISEESRRRSSKGGLRRRLASPLNLSSNSASRGAVRRKVRTLRRLVPGGQGMAPEQLLVRTADYIFQLRLQVHVLRALSNLYPPAA